MVISPPSCSTVACDSARPTPRPPGLPLVEQAGGRQQGPVGIEAPAVVPHFAPQRAVAIFQMQVHARRAGGFAGVGGMFSSACSRWAMAGSTRRLDGRLPERCRSMVGRIRRHWPTTRTRSTAVGTARLRMRSRHSASSWLSVATSARRSGSLTSAEISSASRVMVASGVFSSWAIAAACVARATMPSLRVKRSRSRASSRSRARRSAAMRVENTSTTTTEIRKLAPRPHSSRVWASMPQRPAEQGGQHITADAGHGGGQGQLRGSASAASAVRIRNIMPNGLPMPPLQPTIQASTAMSTSRWAKAVTWDRSRLCRRRRMA